MLQGKLEFKDTLFCWCLLESAENKSCKICISELDGTVGKLGVGMLPCQASSPGAGSEVSVPRTVCAPSAFLDLKAV